MNMLKSLNLSSLKLLALVLALFGTLRGMAMSQYELDERLLGAVQKNDPVKVEELLKLGANKHKVHIWGGSLHHAAMLGCLSCLKIFVTKYDANPNLVGNHGQTPLHDAAMYGNLSCLKLLIEGGATIEKDRLGDTPLHSAARWCKTSCVKTLLEHGADPNATNDDGATPLHTAADGSGFLDQDNKIECIKTLICGGAKLAAKNNKGKTPLDLLKDDKQRNEISQWWYMYYPRCGAHLLRLMEISAAESSEELRYVLPQEILEHIFSYAFPGSKASLMFERAHDYSMACREKEMARKENENEMKGAKK